ncbi:MAG: ABC transporter [Deltaproteobacteria bacterium RBG_16_47_11]|nr:MAG: ABC transporter [Deltaproteobacteria bacterium RBG_16_47_11]
MSSSNLQKALIQTWAFVFKNWIIAKRNVFSLFEILFWPVVGFFSVGFLTSFLELDPNKTGFILVGIIAMSVIQVCQIDVAYVLLYDLWSKSLKHTFIAPVQSSQLILGSWLIGVIRSFFVFLLLSVCSSLVFGFDFWRPGIGPLVLFLLGLFLTAASVGMSVCILVLLFGYMADIAAWSLSSLMALVCGIYYPVFILPFPFPEIAQAIPLTYFLAYFRSFYGFDEGFKNVLGWGFGLAGLYVILEAILFKAVLQRARRTGALIKLSE